MHLNNDSIMHATNRSNSNISNASSTNSSSIDDTFEILNSDNGGNSNNDVQAERVLHTLVTGLQIELHQKVDSQRMDVQLRID